MCTAAIKCPICQEATLRLGTRRGAFIAREFHLEHCPSCQFRFVSNPCTDWEALYDEAYYRGQGADPLVNFVYEIENPSRTIRRYEYAGIVRIVDGIKPLTPRTRWLDFGCGPGGLVRFVRQLGAVEIVGFDPSQVCLDLADDPSLFVSPEQLEGLEGQFDIITAVEVLEHLVDPLESLRLFRRLLRPGGLFLYTTGNAEKHRDRILDWRYFRPETHISLFEPRTMHRAFQLSGFIPLHIGFAPGFEEIILFKILKNLRISQAHWFFKCWPIRAMARWVDRKYGVTSFPVGLVPDKES